MNQTIKAVASKVPEVTLLFWVLKIVATTLGETGGDAVSMTMDLGYALASVIFIGIFLIAVFAQIMAKKFHPILYWVVIVATTTAGTTMADFADRSLGIGYTGGSTILLLLLLLSLGVWYWSEGTIAVETVTKPRVELYYWVTIMFSQTLGTALGDWTADTQGIGFGGSTLIFGAGLAFLVLLYFTTKVSHVFLFWCAFVLTRPLGATLGDLLDKPAEHGGMEISRLTASAVLAAFMIACIFIFPQKAGRHPGETQSS